MFAVLPGYTYISAHVNRVFNAVPNHLRVEKLLKELIPTLAST
jgi:hypothetical protein